MIRRRLNNLTILLLVNILYIILFLLAILQLNSQWHRYCEEIRSEKIVPQQIVPDQMENNCAIRKKIPYPKRVNMGKCPPKFGRIMIFVAVDQMTTPLKSYYGVAQRSLDCYLRSTNYTLKRVDLDRDIRAKQYCLKFNSTYFRKFCVASAYLEDTDWMLILDADTGVVNPNHCIEEWIDDRVNMIFYERFFNWEIASGNFLVKNTEFSKTFLYEMANYEFTMPEWLDNPPLQILILKMVLPDAIIEYNACMNYWNRANDYESLMAYTLCVRNALGAQRIWPPKLRILRRAHGFVRDGSLTDNYWSDPDFLIHDWKTNNLTGWNAPFLRVPNPKKCTGGYNGWNWHLEKRITVDQLKEMWAYAERDMAASFDNRSRIHAHLEEPEIGECYPNCDDHI